MKIKSQITEDILDFLSGIGNIIIASSNPSISRKVFYSLSDEIIYRTKNKHENAALYAKSLHNLSRNKNVVLCRKGNKLFLEITESGRKLVQEKNLKKLEIKKPKKWDRKWRMLIFDISAGDRRKRDILRRRLKAWNFYQLQKSVWIFPYVFKPEMELIKKALELSDKEAMVLTVMEIENESKILKHFESENLK
jgi:DNA-binding transcriptional regulator PaaX